MFHQPGQSEMTYRLVSSRHDGARTDSPGTALDQPALARHAVLDRRDTQFGAVPGHPRVIPADPRQPAPIRGRGGVGIEVRPGHQLPDSLAVLRGGAVERHRDDGAGHRGFPCRSCTHHNSAPFGDRTKSAKRNEAVPGSPTVRGSAASARRRRRPGQTHRPGRAADPRSSRTPPLSAAGLVPLRRAPAGRTVPVLVHRGPRVPRVRQQGPPLPVRVKAHDRGPPVLPRQQFLPPDLAAGRHREADRAPLPGDVGGGDRRRPGTARERPCGGAFCHGNIVYHARAWPGEIPWHRAPGTAQRATTIRGPACLTATARAAAAYARMLI